MKNQKVSNTKSRENSKKDNKKITNKEVYAKITNIIIDQLGKGVIPWENPNIKGIRAQNLITGHIYTGVNPLILQLSDTPFFMTFKQAKTVKASIKKGAKSLPVVFWKVVEKLDTNEDAEEEINKIFVLKYYNVFKITDIENLPERLKKKTDNMLKDNKRIITCEDIIKNFTNPPKIKNFIPNLIMKSNGYSSKSDTVYTQPINLFKSEEHYYSTIFHELIHSTGHESRLSRLEKYSLKFGSKTYAKEELIADLGAAFLMSEAGQKVDYKNRSAYIQSWLKVLENDHKLIITAAGKAEKAVNHIISGKVDAKKFKDKKAA